MNPLAFVGLAWRLYSGHWQRVAAVVLTSFLVGFIATLVPGALVAPFRNRLSELPEVSPRRRA